MLPCAVNTICLQGALMKELRKFDIGLPETRSGATGPSPFKVRDNQRPERTMSGVRKPSPESSVPGETLTGGRRRNQFCRGYGSPSVLNEVSHEFSTAMRFEKCKRSPQQFIPAGFPLHNQLPTGTEDSAIPLTTPDMVRSGRVLQTSVKSPCSCDQ